MANFLAKNNDSRASQAFAFDGVDDGEGGGGGGGEGEKEEIGDDVFPNNYIHYSSFLSDAGLTPHLTRSSSAPPAEKFFLPSLDNSNYYRLSGEQQASSLSKDNLPQSSLSSFIQPESLPSLWAVNQQQRQQRQPFMNPSIGVSHNLAPSIVPDPRTDPAYPAYYYSRSRLDPRLPPPFYSPGQSWQQLFPLPSSLGSNQNFIGGGGSGDGDFSKKYASATNKLPSFTNSTIYPTSLQDNNNIPIMTTSSSLVDRIQADFPRTPSPVYGATRRATMLSNATTPTPNEIGIVNNNVNGDLNLSANLLSTNLEKTLVFGNHSNVTNTPTPTPTTLTLATTNPSIKNIKLKAASSSAPVDSNMATIGFGSITTNMAIATNGNGNDHKNKQSSSQSEDFDSISDGVKGGTLRRIASFSSVAAAGIGHGNTSSGGDTNSVNPIPPIINGNNNSISSAAGTNSSAVATAAAAASNNVVTTTRMAKQPSHSHTHTQMTAGPPSTMLEELKRAVPYTKLNLTDIRGQVISFANDQHGSRFLQQKLDELINNVHNTDANQNFAASTLAWVFDEILPHALSLMSDVFGNYIIQKFLQYGTISQRAKLCRLMQGHVLELSLQMYGCRVIQKVLEYNDHDEEEQWKGKLIKELDGHVIKCVKDQNGNHVIQRALEYATKDSAILIIKALLMTGGTTGGNRPELLNTAIHPYGCRVIQRILEHVPIKPESQTLLSSSSFDSNMREEQLQLRNSLLKELLLHLDFLVQDQYGNYVIQHILEWGTPSEKTQVITGIRGRLLPYSRHKFASNVVEQCMIYSNLQERKIYLDELLRSSSSSSNVAMKTGGEEDNFPLLMMINDQFANYVVQRILDLLNSTPDCEEEKNAVLNKLRPHMASLKRRILGGQSGNASAVSGGSVSSYGKHILTKLEAMLSNNDGTGSIQLRK